MAKVKLREPKSKRNRYSKYTSPLPFEKITREDGTEFIKPLLYVGYLMLSGVRIDDEKSAKELFEKGYFGKGILSKSAPTFYSKKEEKRYIDDLDLEYVPCAIELSSSEVKKYEPLQLMFEEAFFLSYGLGCLIVKDDDWVISIEDMWKKFCTLSENFSYRYICYHHFRSKGWIVKSGLKYGVDFILYKDGPPFYHSTYSVVIKNVSPNLEEKSISWTELSAFTRVSEHVAKDVLLCYVMNPTNEDISNPSCIPLFKVKEILIQRWIPSEERN